MEDSPWLLHALSIVLSTELCMSKRELSLLHLETMWLPSSSMFLPQGHLEPGIYVWTGMISLLDRITRNCSDVNVNSSDVGHRSKHWEDRTSKRDLKCTIFLRRVC